MGWELQRGFPLRMLMVQCRRDPTELHHKVGLVAVQLVEEIAITHQMEDGSTQALLSMFGKALDAWTPVGVRLDQTLMLVTALHPRKGCGFQRWRAAQAPEKSGHHVHEVVFDDPLRFVSVDELVP
jgi:hypothetical protein